MAACTVGHSFRLPLKTRPLIPPALVTVMPGLAPLLLGSSSYEERPIAYFNVRRCIAVRRC